jgi:antitoxin component of RelBE/YafQ-DinJ toxin-antitoxin module
MSTVNVTFRVDDELKKQADVYRKTVLKKEMI